MRGTAACSDPTTWRTSEERERRALAGAIERGAGIQTMPPFDVGRRQRAQSARDFRKRQLGQMPPFARPDPFRESIRFHLVLHC
jgi:hypothetical protein